jgi:hypothetical protein
MIKKKKKHSTFALLPTKEKEPFCALPSRQSELIMGLSQLSGFESEAGAIKRTDISELLPHCYFIIYRINGSRKSPIQSQGMF